MDRIDIYYALESGGVDNWDGYDFAVESAEKDGYKWSDLDEETKLDYLEAAGVDNWSFYDEAIEGYEILIGE